jgi:hypothetical protein
MRLFFSILSTIYIAAIFLLADSPVVSHLAPFNPCSLLHIPLYGILTFLLVFSFLPLKLKGKVPNNPEAHRLSISLPTRVNTLMHFLIPALIASGVGIADEIHQAYIPSRDASIIDVFLDLIGISLVIIITRKLTPKFFKHDLIQ